MQVLHWKHKWAFKGYSQKIESCLCYWHLGRIGNQSFDAKARSILNMFDFSSNSGHNKLISVDRRNGIQLSMIWY